MNLQKRECLQRASVWCRPKTLRRLSQKPAMNFEGVFRIVFFVYLEIGVPWCLYMACG